MNRVKVKILLQTITAQYGTLNAGDILRTSPEFAKHLVEDCMAAEYVKDEVDDASESATGGESAVELPRKSKPSPRQRAPQPDPVLPTVTEAELAPGSVPATDAVAFQPADQSSGDSAQP